MFASVIQGIVQGLTEFLPVSSSGHLVLAQKLFGFNELDPAFNVFVQGGTILSLIFYYAPRLRSLDVSRKYVSLLIVATIPAVIAGILLESQIETMFSSSLGLSFGFFLTTLFIASTYWLHQEKGELTSTKSFAIGVAQAVAILPSLSRSGATIGTALMLGIKAEKAFDFSFLMSIPVMLGSTVLSVRHLTWSSDNTLHYLVGFLVAAVTGYFTLVVLSNLMRQGKFYVFAPYTAILALISLTL